MTNSNISKSLGFHGVWVDVLVPLQADLHIDASKLASHLRNLSAKGFENFVLFGLAGEGGTFSSEEKLAAVTHVIEVGVDPINLLLGVSSSSYTEVVQCIRKAYAAGIRRFLIPAPVYDSPYSHMGLLNYFDHIVRETHFTDWQLYVHQLGGNHQASDLTEATLAELKKLHPDVFVGIVDQDIHVNHTVELIRAFDTALVVATSHEPNLSILHPADVCVSALANVIPNTIRHLIANDFVNTATKVPGMKVAKPDDRVTELMAILGMPPSVAALKLMLSQHYRMESWEWVRPPYSVLSKEAREKLLAAFKTFNLQGHE